MDWRDQGIVLSARKHGENAAIITLLTREHGRHVGLVRGGTGKRARGLYQPGNLLAATWRARLHEHLGVFTCEPVKSHAALHMDHPLKLAALTSACAVSAAALPERQPHAKLFDDFLRLLAALEDAPEDPQKGDSWQAAYVRWELALLADLGYGLALGQCAATGGTQSLIYVSPKTGRAVSASAGEPYRDKLLALPAFLLPQADSAIAPQTPPIEDLLAGLELTGHFLETHLFAPHHRRIPPARPRFVDRLGGMTTISGS